MKILELNYIEMINKVVGNGNEIYEWMSLLLRWEVILMNKMKSLDIFK